jgi:ribonuclease Z
MIEFHQIPFTLIYDIKNGADFVKPNGEVLKNDLITFSGSPAKKYAYCSDTAYAPEITPYIANSDLLYHEATFAESELQRAQETYHSTARQAAEIAKEAEVKKLVIGHYSSRYNELGFLLKEAIAVFPDSELATEGKIFEL